MTIRPAPRSGARTCAYCQAPGPLTREHVFSGFLVEPLARASSRSTATAARTVAGAPVVRDVCKACNNGPLSQLDSAAKAIVDRWIARPAASVVGHPFDPDLAALLRWLLKTSYNAARVDGDQLEAHRHFGAYILGQRQQAPHSCSLLLTVLADYPSHDVTGRPHVVARVGELLLPELGAHLELRRFVSINAFLFLVLAWKPGAPRPARKRVVAELCRDHGLHELRARRPITVPAPSTLTARQFFEKFPLDRPRVVRSVRADASGCRA